MKCWTSSATRRSKASCQALTIWSLLRIVLHARTSDLRATLSHVHCCSRLSCWKYTPVFGSTSHSVLPRDGEVFIPSSLLYVVDREDMLRLRVGFERVRTIAEASSKFSATSLPPKRASSNLRRVAIAGRGTASAGAPPKVSVEFMKLLQAAGCGVTVASRMSPSRHSATASGPASSIRKCLIGPSRLLQIAPRWRKRSRRLASGRCNWFRRSSGPISPHRLMFFSASRGAQPAGREASQPFQSPCWAWRR